MLEKALAEVKKEPIQSWQRTYRIGVIQDMLERARKEQNKEEETPKIINKAEVEIEWIHTIIERQQNKREKMVILKDKQFLTNITNNFA